MGVAAFSLADAVFFANFAPMHHKIPNSVIVRFVILGVIWLGLVAYIIARVPLTLYTLFVIVASAIIVFVPMYKKYLRK